MAPQVGFVGLGNMGKYMATNLANALAAEHDSKLIVYNRTESKAREVVGDTRGAAVQASSLGDIAEKCDIVFTSLGSDDAVQHVVSELIRGATGGQSGRKLTICDTSTIYPKRSAEITKMVNDAGLHYVQALPFGQPPVAKTAQLVFAIAGASEARALVEPFIVPYMGRQLMDFGEVPERASAFKLIGNSMILSTVEMIAETMTLSEKVGIPSERVLEWIDIFYPAPSAKNYGNKIANLKFEAMGGFDLVGGLKDATHIHNLGEQYGCPTHIIDTAIKHIKGAQAANEGQEDKDWAALAGAQRIESGLPPFSK